MIHTIQNGQEADLLLYGEICEETAPGKVGSSEVVRELLQLEKTCNKIRIRINSQGGEVYAGIAIFNAIRNAKCDIEIYTDGVAASIAGIIALCGRKHYMACYSRLMIHAVSGSVFGNVPDLQKMITEITELEKTLSKIISSRMGIAPDEVRERFFDGHDHWLTADEAVKMGFADGVFDNDLQSGAASMPAEDIYNKVLLNQTTAKDDNSLKVKIIKLLKLPALSSDKEVLEAMTELYNYVFSDMEKPGQTVFEKKTNNIWENRSLLISKMVDEAVKERRISYRDKEKAMELGNNIGPLAFSRVIGLLPKKRLVSEDLKQDFPNEEDNQKLSRLEYYRRFKPDYLKKHPEEYKALINEQFKK